MVGGDDHRATLWNLHTFAIVVLCDQSHDRNQDRCTEAKGGINPERISVRRVESNL